MSFPVLMRLQFPEFTGLDFRIGKIVPATPGTALGKQETRSGFSVFSFHPAGTRVNWVDHDDQSRGRQMVTHPHTTEVRVRDGCENARIWPVTRQRAEGILAIHATCDPPCPRVESARSYLEGGQAPCPRT
ncbi:hypothetical protein ACFRAQ_08780 [Nocardia sp. NPDC056611]|uniref:hypothetical protein n=1 Tax=Nocardia sp. NPDC056611 TaxID=3345877 RepID=UPI0036722BCB